MEQFPFNLGDKASFSAAANLAVEARPDGVLVAPIFYDEALPFFDQCKAQDIPYVMFNTHIPEVPAISFIGQNLYQSGRVGAELMMMGQHQPGKFAVLHLDEDIHNAVHLREKERGFREYCQEKSNGSFTVTTQDHTHPGHPGFEGEIAQLVRDPELRGVFISTSKGSFIVAGLIEKLGKKDFRVVGYDLLDESLQYLRHGTIDFLINQNPKRQAFVGIGHLVNHLLFKKSSPPVTLFPLEVITPQNVDSYLSSGFH
ncbi:MAG: substrate-binding domain-containing protein [Bacteroidia bacterium]|nr:substrate-binding domain-containing protein [Bacteroidia bacterium]